MAWSQKTVLEVGKQSQQEDRRLRSKHRASAEQIHDPGFCPQHVPPSVPTKEKGTEQNSYRPLCIQSPWLPWDLPRSCSCGSCSLLTFCISERVDCFGPLPIVPTLAAYCLCL